MEGEIVARVERRRMWSAAEKAALLAEVEAEGGRVSVVAKRHRISESLLYNWRSAWKAAANQLPARMVTHAAPDFVQLGVIAPARDDAPVAQPAAVEPTNGGGAGLTLADSGLNLPSIPRITRPGFRDLFAHPFRD